VVDDEPAIAGLVASYLEAEGFSVRQASSGPDAVTAVREFSPTVVVLDLSLPGIDGIEVARQLRTFSDAYLVILTARAEEVDKLIGLAVGADDYMTKPFSPRELVARVRALLRRPRSETPPPTAAAALAPTPSVSADHASGIPQREPIRVGDLTVDGEAREVRVAGRLIELTRTEFDLLAALAARPGMVFSREELLRSVWGPSWIGDTHAVDVHLAHVRQKLGDSAATQRYVRTVRGVGYRIGPGQ
jgi:DNA-binding response OmpR family regulator